MSDKARVPKWMPIMYVNYFGIISKLANEHGYALCVHGSVVRDFDLICVPFDIEVKPHEDLLKAIKETIGIRKSSEEIYDKVGFEPHGRTCYTIECGGGGYLDISFTPSYQSVYNQLKTDENKRAEMEALIKSCE
jgi:hypothetical protein